MDISDSPGRPAASVCVFSGASAGRSPAYLETAGELGRLLGERRHRLVYGAGGIGLMGAVARAAADAGGDIVGVIPRFLRAREMGDELPRQEILLTEDLLERKRVMLESSDAFIGLPGGYGTWDEVLEVISLAALDRPVGPMVLIDVDGYWQPLRTLAEGLLERGFVRSADLFHVVPGPAEALDLLDALLTGRTVTAEADAGRAAPRPGAVREVSGT